MNPVHRIHRVRRLAAVLAGLAAAVAAFGAPPAFGSTHHVTAAGYRQVRAEFAGSRWPDLRIAGTDYVDLATALLTARGTDGYETVWFYQRLAAACARHGQ